MTEETLPDTVTIPPGCINVRTWWGVPTECALLCGCLALLPPLLFGSWWTGLFVLPIWGWLKYQTHKDPQFLGVWIGQLQFAKEYHG